MLMHLAWQESHSLAFRFLLQTFSFFKYLQDESELRDEKCFMSQPLDTETLFTLLPSYLSIFLDSKITIRVRQKKQYKQ